MANQKLISRFDMYMTISLAKRESAFHFTCIAITFDWNMSNGTLFAGVASQFAAEPVLISARSARN